MRVFYRPEARLRKAYPLDPYSFVGVSNVEAVLIYYLAEPFHAICVAIQIRGDGVVMTQLGNDRVRKSFATINDVLTRLDNFVNLKVIYV